MRRQRNRFVFWHVLAFHLHAVLRLCDVEGIHKKRRLLLPSLPYWDPNSAFNTLKTITEPHTKTLVQMLNFSTFPLLRKQTWSYCCYIGCNTPISKHRRTWAWRYRMWLLLLIQIRLSVDTVIETPKIQVLNYKLKLKDEITTETYTV